MVARATDCSVRRWRWRNVQGKHAFIKQPGSGHVIVDGPIRALLFPSRATATSWPPEHSSSLASTFCQRQWPQARLARAGKAVHDKCMLCAHHAANLLGVDIDCLPEPIFNELPVGDLRHRVCHCPKLAPFRHRIGEELQQLGWPGQNHEGVSADDWLDSVSTGLFTAPMLHVPPPPKLASFEWVRRPTPAQKVSTFYTDGSQFDSEHDITRRLGWAFVGIDDRDRVIAIARGSPPDWISDIPGAESWALLQAAGSADPGARFKSDCQPAIGNVTRGAAWACAANRPHARVSGLLHAAFDDTPPDLVTWVPAHTAEHEVGVTPTGSGQLLTRIDRYCNGLADSHAKIAARHTRVSKQVRDKIDITKRGVTIATCWLGEATWRANNGGPAHNLRDSTASRASAAHERTARLVASGHCNKRTLRTPVVPVPPEQSGRTVVGDKRVVRCAVCRVRGTRRKLASTLCPGFADVAWRHPTNQEAGIPGFGRDPPTTTNDVGSVGIEHHLVTTGQILWCSRCGAYSGNRTRALSSACPGPLSDALRAINGGRTQQLNRLKRGLHPCTGQPIAPHHPAPEGVYLQTAPRGNSPLSTSALRMHAMRRRVRAREGRADSPPPAVQCSNFEALRARVRQRELLSGRHPDAPAPQRQRRCDAPQVAAAPSAAMRLLLAAASSANLRDTDSYGSHESNSGASSSGTWHAATLAPG